MPEKYFLNNYDISKVENRGRIRTKSQKPQGTSIKNILLQYFHDKEEGKTEGKTAYHRLRNDYQKLLGILKADTNEVGHLGLYIGNHLSDENAARKPYRVIATLYWHFDIPYSIFIPESKRKLLLSQKSLAPYEKHHFYNLKDLNSGTQDSQNRYINLMEHCLFDCTEYIKIYEYIGRGSKDIGSLALKNYFKANELIYKLYYKHLKENDGCKYIRIFALPIYEHFNKAHKKNDEISLYLFFKQCSVTTFSHICNVLYNDNPSIKNHSKFYIAYMPIRMYQYAIFDRNKIYNEYYALDKDGISRPTFAFVNTTSDNLEEFAEMMTNEFDGLLRHCTNISKKSIYTTIQKLNGEFQSAIENGKHKMEDLYTLHCPKENEPDDENHAIKWNAMAEIFNGKLNVLHNYLRPISDNRNLSYEALSELEKKERDIFNIPLLPIR